MDICNLTQVIPLIFVFPACQTAMLQSLEPSLVMMHSECPAQLSISIFGDCNNLKAATSAMPAVCQTLICFPKADLPSLLFSCQHHGTCGRHITGVPQDGAGPRAHALSSFLAQQRWCCRLLRFLFTAIFQLPEIYCFFHRQLDFSSRILPAQGLLFQECCSWLTQWGQSPLNAA